MAKNARKLIVVILLAAASSQLVVRAEAEQAGCSVFGDREFKGKELQITPNQSMASLTAEWNDAISSVKVRPGCLLVAFKEAEYRGQTQTFGPGNHHRLPTGWDDQISSVRCNCR